LLSYGDAYLGQGEVTSDNKSEQKFGLIRLLTSVPVLMLLILLTLEIWLRQGHNHVDALNIRSADLWGCVDRLALVKKVRPQAVLIGSSLIMSLDQTEEGKNYLTGYDPVYLRSLLDKATGKKISCITLASGAQMVSESYFLAQAASATSHPPGVIIYGAALRDFVQDQLAGEWKTDTFNSVAPYVPLTAVPDIYSEGGLIRFFGSHFCYLYRDRDDFKNLFAFWAKEALEHLPLDQPFMRLDADCYWKPIKSGYLMEEWVARRQETVLENLRIKNPARLRDYFKRFQSMFYRLQNKETSELSDHYFKALQRLCKRKNIMLVVVNMPLSPDTATIVPPVPMQIFRDYLKAGGDNGGYYFIDLWADPRLSDADYKDGVHFKMSGLTKFTEIFVQLLQKRYPAVLKRMADQSAAEQPGASK